MGVNLSSTSRLDNCEFPHLSIREALGQEARSGHGLKTDTVKLHLCETGYRLSCTCYHNSGWIRGGGLRVCDKGQISVRCIVFTPIIIIHHLWEYLI